jgi:hypothetical protein
MKALLAPLLFAFVAIVAASQLAPAQVPAAPSTMPEDTDKAGKPAAKPDPKQDPGKQDPRKPLIQTNAPKDPGAVNRPGAAPAMIEKPADPARARASYEIGGTRVTITDGEFYDAQQRLHHFEPKNVGRLLNAERVYEWILAYAEAKALGLEATPEEVALFDPLQTNPALKADAQRRWEAEKVTQEMYDTYQKELRTIQKAKDLFVNSTRVLSNEVFDAYRRDHFTYRLEYVEFPASRYADVLKKTKPADADLERFWKEDKAAQNKLRGRENVTAEFVSFDPSTASNGAKPPEVPNDEALAYYKKNKARLDAMIPAEERSQLYPTTTVPLAELKTPFQILQRLGTISREIHQSARMKAAFEEAKKPGADLKDLAAKSNLTYEKVEKVDRDAMIQKHARYGPQIFSVLFNHAAGEMSPDVRMEPQIQFFYRVIAKEGATLPDFEVVKDKLVEQYIETTSLKQAQTAANELRAAIDKKVDAEIRTEEERLLKDADAAAEAEIKSKNLTDAKATEQVKTQHRGAAMVKVRQMKDQIAPKHFDAVVKELGATVVDTGPFDLISPRREMGMGEEYVKRKFLMANPTIRNMDAGQITQVMTDASTRTHFIVRIAEKTEPDYAKMSDGDLLAVKAQTERARAYQPIQRFQYADISRRRQLAIN